MALLSSSGNECYVCGKDVEEGDCIEHDGEKFCCQKCRKKYEDEEKSDEKEICEYC